jgi:glycosyltransferase involved in cell wall biosynthesis
MKNTLVSVIIPSRNRLNLLKRAVNSVVLQSYESIEIIIVDDCSSDDILISDFELIDSHCDIKIIRNAKPLGGAVSRNRGVEASSGEYFCFLDDDDIYYHDKISNLAHQLDSNHSIDVVFGKVVLNNNYNTCDLVKYPSVFNSDFNFFIGNYIHTNSSLIRRHTFDFVKFDESLPKFQDTQYHLELSIRYNVFFVNEYVAEWFIDNRLDQITSMKNESGILRTITGFNLIKNKFLEEFKVTTKNKAYFLYYSMVLSYKYKVRMSKLDVFIILKNPILIFYIIKVIYIRNKFINKLY